MIGIFVFLTVIFVFLTLKHNEASLDLGISLDEQDDENRDESLSEGQGLGPKWSGKIASYLQLIVEISAFYHCLY